MRKVCENMAGLIGDYQMVLKDTVLRDAINELAEGSLEMTIEKDHDTNFFRLDRQEYPGGLIKQGTYNMNTMELMHYVLAEDKDPEGKKDERSYRKNAVMTALIDKIKLKNNPQDLANLAGFFKSHVDSRDLQVDFNLNLMQRGIQLLSGIRNTNLLSALRSNTDIGIPQVDKSKQVIFHDAFFGDGGVTRVHNIADVKDPNRHDNPKLIEEINQGYLPSWMLIPDGGNPIAEDLVADYWHSVREMVKKILQSS